MKEFNFTIRLDKNAKDSELVFIDAFADEWDEPVQEEKFIGIASLVVQQYLKGAYCMYGKFFNFTRHSPRQLYEALLGNPEYEVVVDGEIPEETGEDDLPPGAVS